MAKRNTSNSENKGDGLESKLEQSYPTLQELSKEYASLNSASPDYVKEKKALDQKVDDCMAENRRYIMAFEARSVPGEVVLVLPNGEEYTVEEEPNLVEYIFSQYLFSHTLATNTVLCHLKNDHTNT